MGGTYMRGFEENYIWQESNIIKNENMIAWIGLGIESVDIGLGYSLSSHSEYQTRMV